MTISVRSVHFECDGQELLGILQTNLPDLPHARRFQWLYRANPDGPAWSWFACQGTPGQAVGVTSVFPRSMWVGDQLRMCGQVGDFAISASHRSLGPAVLLQRATFEPVDQGKLSFCYDCPPHEAGMSTFRRLGIQANCAVERYALPLRVDRHIKTQLGSHWVFLASAGNLLLRIYRRPRPAPKGLDISEYVGPFGEEFSQLDAAVRRPAVIRGQRSAAHLNWRYREDPLQQYEVLTARRKGELLAFVVYCRGPEDVTIVDLFGADQAEVSIALLEGVVQRCGPSHQGVEAFLSEGNELSRALLRARFRRRSAAARVVAYAKPGSDISAFLKASPRWTFSQADIRV
jgi:hypothetical protein